MIRSLGIAFSFLTRAPVPGGGPTVADAELGRAISYFPLVGLALGAAVAGVVSGLGLLVPGPLVAVGAVAFLALVTGGLHIDGVADLFDALGGGRGDRARMLEIMRDSRVGAHGATAVSLVMVAKVAALWLALGQQNVLIAFPLVGRWAVVPLVAMFPYARETGIGHSFNAHAGLRQVGIATALLCAALWWLGPGELALGVVAALVVSVSIGVAMSRRLGGLTGDVYGAAIELAELAFLACAV